MQALRGVAAHWGGWDLPRLSPGRVGGRGWLGQCLSLSCCCVALRASVATMRPVRSWCRYVRPAPAGAVNALMTRFYEAHGDLHAKYDTLTGVDSKADEHATKEQRVSQSGLSAQDPHKGRRLLWRRGVRAAATSGVRRGQRPHAVQRGA